MCTIGSERVNNLDTFITITNKILPCLILRTVFDIDSYYRIGFHTTYVQSMVIFDRSGMKANEIVYISHVKRCMIYYMK